MSSPVGQHSAGQFGNADVYFYQLSDDVIVMTGGQTMEISKIFQLDDFEFLYVKDTQAQVLISQA